MENISIDELHERIQNLGPNDLILDVRSTQEYQEGHIKGSQNTQKWFLIPACDIEPTRAGWQAYFGGFQGGY